MSFINPKTDFAFKKIFASEASKNILISFLNAILYAGENKIQDLVILDPYQAPRIRGMKQTYLDVKAIVNSNVTLIIEMQVLNVQSLDKRLLYNAAKSYSAQLSQGADYDLLAPIIALTITDFEMFENLPTVISRYVLKETTYLADYLNNDLQLVFVELPKFQKTLAQLETITDKWIYFLKEASNLQNMPENMVDVPEIKHAFEVANRANLTIGELDDLERQEMFLIDQRNILANATQTTAKAEKMTIAKNLLSMLDDRAISQATGLTIDQVQQLRSA